ncbi:MAG: tripartite tricarboxylate transporter permease [Candidatus Aenigmarchaeota archaeon]|nr:tripartite tricarboxylate transporter permease [Candidatus Aenigmarchaeota archaeon]
MLDILLFSLLGIFVGIAVGLLPGIHPNQIYIILVSILPLLSFLSEWDLIAFVLSISISNVISNYIPTIFFSIPDSNTAINVLPGHKMVLEGRGLEALYISLISGILTLLISTLLLPIFLILIPFLYDNLHNYIHFLLIGLFLIMAFFEKGNKKYFFILVFIISGIWGIITLNSPLIKSENVLFPSLTGMFGLAGLLIERGGLKKLPTQRQIIDNINNEGFVKTVSSGIIAGLLVGILPGAGESQAGVLVSHTIKLSDKEFLGTLSGINMSNLLFSIVSLSSLEKIRSGTALAINEIVYNFNTEYLLFSVGILIFSGSLSVIFTWFLGKKTLLLLSKINYDLVSKIIILFTCTLVLLFTGFWGFFILIISIFIGLLPILFKIKRTSCMGYLMLSTIIYFSGLSNVIGFLFL